MPGFWQNRKILLGAGRKKHEAPRVDALDVVSLEVIPGVSFDRGHSPYVLARSDDGLLFVAGTRRGQIHVFRNANGDSHPTCDESLLIRRGSAQLAACVVPGPGLVASDDSATCMWWPGLDGPVAPLSLETGSGNICALLSIERAVVGLASNGEILHWDLPGTEPVVVTRAPAPPREYALIRFTSWTRPTMLVYPSRDGQIAVYDLEDKGIHLMKGHEGGFHAVCVVGDTLLTMGRYDSIFRVWQFGEEKPVAEYEAPDGIIAMAAVPTLDDGLLLVDHEGSAAIWVLEAQRLCLERRYPGGDYRVLLSTTDEEFTETQAERRAAEMAAIVGELNTRSIELSQAEVQNRHDRLVTLGGEHVSLELRARKASEQQRSDPHMLVEELRLRDRQVGLLPEAEEAVASLLVYANLLVQVWALQEAQAVYEKVQRISPDHFVAERIAHLDRYIEAMDEGRAIIAPDEQVPFEVLANSASVLRKPIAGRFLVARYDPLPWCGSSYSASSVAAKYSQVVQARGEAGKALPKAVIENIVWLTRPLATPREVVSFTQDHNADEINVGIVLSATPGATTVSLSVVLDISPAPCSFEADEHNQLVLEVLREAKETGAANAWCRDVYRAIRAAIVKLNNEAAACRMGQGGIHDERT